MLPLCKSSAVLGAKMQSHYAEYGNTKLPRAYCYKCRSHAFVIDDIIQCCSRYYDFEAEKIKKMCLSSPFRKIPPIEVRKRILEKQQNRCLYCELEFGSIIFRKTKPMLVKLAWDHQIPFAYAQNNKDQNFCASCQVCNGIKSSIMFQTLDEAKLHILHIRKRKGYSS